MINGTGIGKIGVAVWWLGCLTWTWVATTSNWEFTSPLLGSMVRLLAFGLSLPAAWWLGRSRRLGRVRYLAWVLAGLQWAGLALAFPLQDLFDNASPLDYFTGFYRWRTTGLLFYRGPVVVVTQELRDWRGRPLPPPRPLPPDALPLEFRHPVFPGSRQVMLEPGWPGLQRVSVLNTPGVFDSTWTMVNPDFWTYSADSAIIRHWKPLDEARQREAGWRHIRSWQRAHRRQRDSLPLLLTPATRRGAGTLSFELRATTFTRPEESFPLMPVVYRARRASAIYYAGIDVFSIEGELNIEGCPGTITLEPVAGTVRHPKAHGHPPRSTGEFRQQDAIVLDDGARFAFYRTPRGTAAQLTITHLDTVARIISGTFGGELRDRYGASRQALRLRQGRFDVRYTISPPQE
jgi:hypothetical protein